MKTAFAPLRSPTLHEVVEYTEYRMIHGTNRVRQILCHKISRNKAYRICIGGLIFEKIKFENFTSTCEFV